MKTFIYYLTLITLAAIMQGCTGTVDNYTTSKDTIKRVELNDRIYLGSGLKMYKVVLEGHDYYYIYINDIIVHSANCRACKKERNEIINKLLNK